MAEEEVAFDPGAYLDAQPKTEDELPEVKPKKLTFYYPETPENTRAAGLSYSMEGGIKGGPGFSDLNLPDHTLEKFKAGESQFVAVAMHGRPTGDVFRMLVEGTPIIAKNVDTGGGLVPGQVDVATSNPDLARGGGYGGGGGGAGGAGMLARPAEPISLPDAMPKEEPEEKKKRGIQMPSLGGGGGAQLYRVNMLAMPKMEIPETPSLQGNVIPSQGMIGQAIPQQEYPLSGQLQQQELPALGQATPTASPDNFSQAVQQAVTQPAEAALLAGPPTAGAVQQAFDPAAYLAQQVNVTPAPSVTPAGTPMPSVTPSQGFNPAAYLANQRVAQPAQTPVSFPSPPQAAQQQPQYGISSTAAVTPAPGQTPTPDFDPAAYLAQQTSPNEILPSPPAGTAHPFLQGAATGLKKLVPQVPRSAGEGAQMAWEQTVPGQAISQAQQLPGTFQKFANLETIKQEHGGGSPEYQQAAGELAGEILPTMIMAAGGVKATMRKRHPEARTPNEATRMSGEVIPESPESAAAAQAATGGRLNKIAKAFRSLRDVFTTEPLPNLRRAGIRDSGYAHASSRTAIGPMAKDLVSRVFPDQYKDPQAMKLTGDTLVKDNVLGIYDQLRSMLQRDDLSKQLRDRLVQNVMDLEGIVPLAEYDKEVRAMMNDPVVSANMERWKQQVNPEMDAMYKELHGEDPNFQPDPRGRHFGARVNLLPEWDTDRLVDLGDHTKAMPEPSYSNYRNPNVKRDPFARHAAGTGKYVNDPEAMLTNTLSQRWNEVTKLRFYKDIVATGNGVITELGASSPPKSAGMVRMPITMPETGPNGNVQMVERNLWIKKEIADEARQVLNVDKLGMGHPLFQWVTSLQLLQAVDMVAHMKNIHTVIANSFRGIPGALEMLSKFPGVSSVDTVARMASVIREIAKDTPAIRAELADMAKRGEIRPKYPSTGIQKITKGQDAIHAADTAARVIMKRFWEENVQKGRVVDTSDARRTFVNKIGEYNQRVMNDFQRRARALGLSPFVVAGRSFNQFSRRLVFGSPGFKPANIGQSILLRGMNVSSLAITASIVAGFNYAITGNPGGRDGVPLGAVDTGQTDEKGKPIVVDVFQVLGIRRGLRATGLNAVIEGFRQGKSFEKIAVNAMGDAASSAIFPWYGPGLQALVGALPGKRLDFRGGGDVYQVSKKLKPGEGIQQIENLRGQIKETNPLLYSLIAPVFHEVGYEEPKWQQPSPLWGSESAGRIKEGLIKAPLSALGVRSLTREESGQSDRGTPAGFYLGK